MLSICRKVQVLVCLPLSLSPYTLFCHCISSNDFLWTSLHNYFELIHIFKAIATGCGVGFCIWPLLGGVPNGLSKDTSLAKRLCSQWSQKNDQEISWRWKLWQLKDLFSLTGSSESFALEFNRFRRPKDLILHLKTVKPQPHISKSQNFLSPQRKLV